MKIAFALITWIYSFLLAVPPLFGFSQYKLEGYEISCSFDHLSRDRLTRSYIFYLFWGGLILPVCLITFSYAKIYLLVRNSQKFGDDEEPAGTNKQTEMQPILTVPASSHGSTASNKCRLANNNNSSETTNTLIGPVSGESKLFRKTQSHSTNKEIQLAIVIFLAILVFIISWVPYSLMTLTAQFGPRGTISPAVISITSFLAKLSVMYNPFIYWYKDENFKKRSKQLIFCRNGAISS